LARRSSALHRIEAKNLALGAHSCDVGGVIHRRSFLAALTASMVLGSTCRTARAQSTAGGGPRLKSIARDEQGTTVVLGLDHAPFPSPGAPYQDDTVLVFVPSHHRYHAEEGLSVLVHFHGHNTTAERATAAHQLREQLSDSRQNAILVVPQLALSAPDSGCGKLEAPGGLARLLEEAMIATSRQGRTFGDSRFPSGAALGTVCISAHSGGYHAATSCLRSGGIDVRETYLFDALYAEVETVRDWVIARRGEPLHRRHKLVDYFVESTATEVNSLGLRAELERAGVLCQEEQQEGVLSRHDLSHAEAVFVRTGVYHSQVTWETNALRDCLYASALPRHLSSDWFARKRGARPIERRR